MKNTVKANAELALFEQMGLFDNKKNDKIGKKCDVRSHYSTKPDDLMGCDKVKTTV